MSITKVAKTIAFTAQATADHHGLKIKNVLKWLKTGHEVRVQINGKEDRQKAMETVFRQLEKEVSSGAKLLQKTTKPNQIKFVLTPTADAANLKIDTKPSSDSNDDPMIEIKDDQDIFSNDFEEELNKSIKDEKSKNRRK